ncbi:MAG: hypothetical protein IKN56_08675, partial [Clostridia bacterium]|nr:hypothetical protein [Clostridia bacterium]
GQRAFYTELGEELPEEGNLVSSMDTYADWNVEDGGEFSVEYSGRESTVSLSIVKNTITRIDYQRNGKDEYLEGDTRYDEYDDAYYYDNPSFREGDVLTVYEGETPSVYTCVFNRDIMEYEFLSEDETSSIPADWDSGVRISTNQRENPWTLGDKNEFYVEYMGSSKTLYATVKENPVLSFSYERANPDTYLFEEDGYEYDGIFEYFLRQPDEGDVLTVNYKDLTTVKYVCHWNEKTDRREFVSENGEVISDRDVDIYADQRNHPWEIGDKNEYTVSYSGISITLFATVMVDPVESIEYNRSAPAVIYENTDGWWDDENNWRYNEPGFLEGDTITLTYTDSSTKVFTFGYNEDLGYSVFSAEDGEYLNDVYTESHQWETPWTVGSNNEYFLNYRGKYSSPKYVTIIQSDIESIEYKVINPERLVLTEHQNGSWETEDGEEYFRYNYQGGWVGDTLTINYKDKTSSVYTVKFDGTPGGVGVYLENDKGERIAQSEVDIFDRQWDEHWYVGEENCYFVKYSGATCAVPVTINHNYQKKVVCRLTNQNCFLLLYAKASCQNMENKHHKLPQQRQQ